MILEQNNRHFGCAQCVRGAELGFDFSMAFQPIVDVTSKQVFAHEALVRGVGGESAASVFQLIDAANIYRFDQTCRVKAIEMASRLFTDAFLSINFLPLAIYRPERCIRTTLEAARVFGFPCDKIIFEFTEQQKVDDLEHVRSIVDCYKDLGFLTAIDDFGAGHAGLNLLAELETDIVKIDMQLIRDIDTHPRKRSIVAAVLRICRELSVKVIVEGVETRDEFLALQDLGAELFQGYYFAKPAFEALAEVPDERFIR